MLLYLLVMVGVLLSPGLCEDVKDGVSEANVPEANVPNVNLPEAVLPEANVPEPVQRPLIESLITDYIKAESELWTVLASHDSSALQAIYNLHEPFLNKTIGSTESGIFKSQMLPQNLQARNSALLVNLSTIFCYSHFESKSNFSDYKIMVKYANYSKQFISRADALYNITQRHEFWDNITLVSTGTQ